MSEIRVDSFKAEDGISAPSFPNGIQVTGVVTATVLDTSVDFLDVGSNIKAGNSGILTVTELKATNVSVAGTLTYEDVTNVDSIGVVTARTGLKVTSGEATVGSNIKLGNAGVITATSFHGSGASLTGIDATALKDPAGNVKIQAQASGAVHTGVSTFSGAITASGGVVGNVTGNVTGNVSGSAGSIDVANVSSNSTYYPMFVDNNGSAKSVYIDNGSGLTFNPSTNILTAGTVKGKGTVEVHGYNLSNAGDVGHGSNYWAWNMTPTIPWDKCILGHTGCHRASNDTHYYWYYAFDKGGGYVDQITLGVGRAHMQTNHNQGGSYTGIAMHSNGSFMSGNANVQCSFKMYLSTGGNSAPASDSGYDHHAWAMFIHS